MRRYAEWAADETGRVLNPDTGAPFKVGDVFEGRRFKCYMNRTYGLGKSMKIPMWSSEEAYQRRQARKHETVKQYMGMRTRNIDGLVTRMLANCRYRCKASGGTCTISRAFLMERIREGYVVNGVKVRDFDITHDGATTARSPWAPSIDRIDSSDPSYTEANVQVVPWAVNCARNEFGDAVLVQAVGPYIDYLRQQQNCVQSH